MKGKTFKATGMQYYMDGIISVASENPAYHLSSKELKEEFSDGDRIYEYEFYPDKVELVPEPENEYDPNAIAVFVDGHKVGHIKKGSCSEVKNLLSNPLFGHIEAEMGGGKYKEILYDEDDDGKETIVIDNGFINYYVHITFF